LWVLLNITIPALHTESPQHPHLSIDYLVKERSLGGKNTYRSDERQQV